MTFPSPKALSTISFELLFIAFSLSSPAPAQNRPEQARAMNQRPYANSVILQGGNHAQTMQRLHVVRQYALQDLRSNPHVMLGEAQLDFTPMLNNAKALPNVAIRLQALPQHVQVQANTSDVTEVDQGLVIHHLLTYQILPGKCADRRREGAACGSRSFVLFAQHHGPARGGVQRAGQPALHCRPRKAAGGDRGIPAEERGGGCGCEPAHRRTCASSWPIPRSARPSWPKWARLKRRA